mmetsp:Transcript_11996/g.18398  ORF Transcript_11996/g.18398 Transcript_11996/m.18398 type:complete len:99 (-) Transcript_11996:277-573(-)
MRQDCENSTRRHCKFPMTESILSFIVGGTNRLLETDCINNARSRGDVQNFHNRIVEAVERSEEVRVSCKEDKEKELVSAKGDALRITSDAKSKEEHND